MTPPPFPAATYHQRRTRLAELVGKGTILLRANPEAPINYAGNDYPYRQDSTFLYFAGLHLPGLILTIDAATGESRLYGDDRSLDDVIWMGEMPKISKLAESIGTQYGGNRQAFDGLKQSDFRYLPAYRAEHRLENRRWFGHDGQADEELIRAVVALRAVKSPEEIAEMDRAVRTTMRMHDRARQLAVAGTTEAEIAGVIEGMAISAGGRLAYPAIVSRDGQILHNHRHHHTLENGDLLLIDAGAEAPSGYAGDITRTPVVGGRRNDRQQLIHDTVQRAKAEAIAVCRPGVPFAEVHQLAARVLIEGLQAAGLMRGDVAEAAAAGAHALFFPHGLGHMIGLDVHDMQDLGEDFVGYDESYRRSEQFGTRNLRLGRALWEGFTITVEPGLYFIPALIDRWKADRKFTDFINYGALESWRDFGGIRLEDNLVITSDGSEILGA